MKGKNIIWTVFAILLVLLTLAIPTRALATSVFVDPPSIVDTTKVAETTFTVDIKVADVTDLYTWSFFLRWTPAVLNVTSVVEGPFLAAVAPEGTFLIKTIYQEAGYIDLACSILGDYDGATGSGTLATVTFLVETTGETLLNLENTSLLDSDVVPISHTATGGYFCNVPGAPAELVGRSAWPDYHHFVLSKAGNIQNLFAKVKNLGTYPTCVKVRFTAMFDGTPVDVETPEYIVAPGEIPPPPSASLDVGSLGLGKYHVTAQCWYRYYSPLLSAGVGPWTATDTKSFSFAVVP